MVLLGVRLHPLPFVRHAVAARGLRTVCGEKHVATGAMNRTPVTDLDKDACIRGNEELHPAARGSIQHFLTAAFVGVWAALSAASLFAGIIDYYNNWFSSDGFHYYSALRNTVDGLGLLYEGP